HFFKITESVGLYGPTRRSASVRILTCSFIFVVLLTTTAAGQTVYWKKDHIYAGLGGKEIAIVTPTPTDQTAPTAPSGLAASSITATSVHLVWTGSSDNSGGSGLAGYKIYRQKTPTNSNANLPVATVGSTQTSFDDAHLQPSVGYSDTVVAFDQAQNHSS